jgi:uncharacterized membrane protein
MRVATHSAPAESVRLAPQPRKPMALRSAFEWSGAGLVAVSWFSAACFGVYILAYYLGAIPAGHWEQWNGNLPGLYSQAKPFAVAAISAHFATGAVILLLGPLQLVGELRCRYPRMHRYVGRVYVFASGVAGLGGLGFIISKGTIGGEVMNLGFGLYGALIILGAAKTYQNARARRLDAHRAWAIRLFALAIGSWLYRMDYGIWLTAAHRLGHTKDFRGPFDMVMAFFFYLPNLALAELFLRSGQLPRHPVFRFSAAVVLNFASLFVAVGTYYFLRYYWGPAIIEGLFGRAG